MNLRGRQGSQWRDFNFSSEGTNIDFHFHVSSDIPYLRELRLDSNPLQKVEANAFEMVPQLVHLDLSGCSIKGGKMEQDD